MHRSAGRNQAVRHWTINWRLRKMTSFCPSGSVVGLPVAGSSSRVQLSGADAFCGAVRIRNSNTNAVFLKFGDDTVTATTSDMAMDPSSTEVLRIPPGATYLA